MADEHGESPPDARATMDGRRALALLGALPDAVALVGGDGTIEWVSPQSAGALGWDADSVVGRSIFDLFAKQVNRSLHVDALAETVRAPGLHGPIEVTMVRPDGTLREIEFMVWNALDDPEIGQLVAVGRDITERDHESESFRQRDAWASSLLRGSPELTLVTDRSGSIAYASPSSRRILGREPAELVERNVLELVHPEDLLVPAGDGISLDRILGTGPGRDRIVRCSHGDGSWPRLRLERTINEDLGEHLVVLTGSELTAEREAATLLSEQTLVLERIARGAPLHDALRMLIEMASHRLTSGEVVIGWPEGTDHAVEADGLSGDLLAVLERSGIAALAPAPPTPGPDGMLRSAAWDTVVDAASAGRFGHVVALDLVGDDGPAGRLVVLRAAGEELTNEERDVLAVVADLATIAVERQRLQRRLARGALYDELTGLANRRELMARLRETFDRRGARAGLLYVDLDRFKLINDSLGHEAGDHLLREVTRRFTLALRPADLVARVGGDEFVVLCPDLDGPDEVAALAERLTASLVEPVDLPGGRIVVSASVGVVHAIGPADPAEVLQDGDLAMYEAKERGRNRIARFHVGLRDKALARLEVETALRDALRAEEMMLHFQPVVRLATGKVVGVEALLRWDRPGIGLVRPGAFVPVATDTGLILPLGRWVIDEACQAAARWPELEVAANLSARQLADADLVDFVAERLDAHGVPPDHLCLEVTEADLVTDPDSVVVQLRRFKELGVRLAIDDFGTGFATLDYLRRFSAADVLKVDASFVAGLTDPSKHDLAIVSAALVLADNLGFDTIAEGVETEPQREVLERLGCELAQGHLFSEPITADAIDALLAGGAVVHPSRP
jgi:diguanylate cyclase (GGDEF)-like protein/PAS domain S-box-containing protein